MVDTTTQNPLNEPTKKAGPGLWPSLIAIAAGIALMSWGVWTGFQSVAELIFVDSFETPGSQTRDLDAGDYEIYGLVAEVDIFEFEVDAQIALPTIDDITVTKLDTGQQLLLEPKSSVDALGRQSNVYDLVAAFEVTEPGEYEVVVNSPEPARALFGRTFESFGDRLGTPILFAVLGLLLTVLGIAMLIAGVIRRKRQRERESTAGPTYGATPGAFPTPSAAPPPAPGAMPTSPSSTPTPTPPPAAPPSPDQPSWPSASPPPSTPPPDNPEWPT